MKWNRQATEKPKEEKTGWLLYPFELSRHFLHGNRMVEWDDPRKSRGRIHGEIFSWRLIVCHRKCVLVHANIQVFLPGSGLQSKNGQLEDRWRRPFNIKREDDKEKKNGKEKKINNNGSESFKESRISRGGSVVLEYASPFQGRDGPGIPWQWHLSESLQPGFQQK